MSKYRKQQGQGRWLIGFNVIQSVLEHHPEDIDEILISQQRQDQRQQNLEQLAQRFGVKIRRVSNNELDRQFPDERHQGVAAKYSAPDFLEEDELKRIIEQSDHPFLLILDQIQDPRNFGACLRTAEAAGVDCVVVPKDGSAGLTTVARKAASGAAERLAIVQVTNLARCLRNLKQMGVWLYGADGRCDHSLYSADLSGSCAVIMGSEGQGLRRLTREHCDHLVAIPMQSQVESLNVSVAAGIMMFEVVRQRLAKA